MMTWSRAFSSATSVPGLNCSMCVAWRFSAWPRGSMTISVAPRLTAFLMKVAATGWLIGRVGADDDDDVGIRRRRERRRDGARADRLHQRGDRRGVAEPRAVVDVVAAEAGAHQLLEQVGLLVRALGRAEAGQRRRRRARRGSASGPAAATSSASSQRRLAEMRPRVGRIDLVVGVLRHARLADQRRRQAVSGDGRSRSRSGP